MKLVDVYRSHTARHLLYALLGERRPDQSISHKTMPTWEQHCDFVASRPYLAWYIAEADNYARGACYLTHRGEIGVAIFEECQGNGYGSAAVTELMRLHPGIRFLANINPANEASIALFRSLGFGGPIQITLEKQ